MSSIAPRSMNAGRSSKDCQNKLRAVLALGAKSQNGAEYRSFWHRPSGQPAFIVRGANDDYLTKPLADFDRVAAEELADLQHPFPRRLNRIDRNPAFASGDDELLAVTGDDGSRLRSCRFADDDDMIDNHPQRFAL